MLISLCLSLLQSYDTKEPKTKFLSLKFFRGGGYNSLIINTMKNLFLHIFHLTDYQAVTRMTNQYLGKQRKTLIFCVLYKWSKKKGQKRRKRHKGRKRSLGQQLIVSSPKSHMSLQSIESLISLKPLRFLISLKFPNLLCPSRLCCLFCLSIILFAQNLL